MCQKSVGCDYLFYCFGFNPIGVLEVDPSLLVRVRKSVKVPRKINESDCGF